VPSPRPIAKWERFDVSAIEVTCRRFGLQPRLAQTYERTTRAMLYPHVPKQDRSASLDLLLVPCQIPDLQNGEPLLVISYADQQSACLN